MGKSPGKWIKGILFGKKTTKPNLSKGRELSRSASEKTARVSSKEPLSAPAVDAPLISNPVPGTDVDTVDNSSFKKGEAAILASDGRVSSLLKNGEDKPSDPGLSNEPEKIGLELAATVVQASFRCYQARRAFQTLKGIIRLQATVRGHLVRRQAVATLFCMQGIVKFQAITRGYMIRQSGTGNGQCKKQILVAKDHNNQDSCESKHSQADTLLKNAFVHELLSSAPSAMPLRLQYDPGEPNSAWGWLLRWSTSQVWGPNSKRKESGDPKLQRVETEQNKSKCNGRRALSATVRNGPNHTSFETGKLKQKGRKPSSQSVKSAQEHTEFGNNKVKRDLKKIQKPTGEISNEAEIDVDKSKTYPRKLSKSPAPTLSKQTSNTPTDKSTEDLAEAAEPNDRESSLEFRGANSPANQSTNHLASEEHPKLVSGKGQDILPVDKDFKDDQIGNENYKSSRRTSLPAKHDDQEATPESMTRVPSYMATTASSKAKVKMQVSPRFGQDAVDKNGLTRRHSLPSFINGKLISSPRVHRLVQVNGREGIKIDRSLSSSRDVTDRVIHVDWKR